MRARTFKLNCATLLEEKQQPWELIKSGFEPDPPIPSMICVHERKFLHYLAKYHFSGKGAIVDLGPLAGSSTYALASGTDRGTIFSYDLWRFFPGWEKFTDGRKLPIGEDIQQWFLRNIAAYSHRVIPRKGSLLDYRWTDGPIGILFVDVAKSQELMLHIANEFFPSLSPGAFVIHQDFVSAEDPWIHIAMGLLAEYFEIVDSPEGGTVCFRLLRKIPKNVLPKDYCSHPSARYLLAQARDLFHSWHGSCVWLAAAHYELLQGKREAAAAIVRSISEHYDKRVQYDMDLVTGLLEKKGWLVSRVRKD